ncbi:MAG: HEAT repeat domain-containing protein [Verrucomicrobiae bacterium]|nr:HEAT repeat domain-containing protein [Verrucomicrobiae bacterium]
MASLCGGTLAGSLRAADLPEPGLQSISVPEGFRVSNAVTPGLISYPMFAAFDETGHLYVAESSGKDVRGAAMAATPECRIRRLEDTDGDGVFDSSIIFADEIGIPMGILWHQGAVYVASPPDLLRFEDADNDGIADQREAILTGWNVKGTASLHGPFLGPDGWLYLTDGRHGYDIHTKEGTHLTGLASRIWKCRTDGSGLTWFAGGGFDNPVELTFTESGEIIGTMTYFTDPKHGQRDALMHFIRGGVYGKDHASVAEFKQTGPLLGPMARFARVAPAGLHQYRGTRLGDGFQHNLFSAHFNPHRVLRHQIIRTNASFVSTDSDFLISAHPDFHPTDVLEDGDGTLLVVDTGGWYVDQCPLSRISRPEFQGGLYRVDRIGAHPLHDPRGNNIDWPRVRTAELVALLEDPRPAVADRARERIATTADRGTTRLLANLRARSANTATRCAAVWLLHRLGDRKGVRDALSDPHAVVRAAAANASGLALDHEAIDSLHTLLSDHDLTTQREAASALGLIGKVASNGPLISAAANITNRFVEHAITYSLIENYSRMTNSSLKRSLPQLPRLPAGSARAALIAFDQMDGSVLKDEHVEPLLDYPDDRVREAAAWVYSRHPDWSTGAVSYLQRKLFHFKLTKEEMAGVSKLLTAFMTNPAIQKTVAEAFSSEDVPEPRKEAIIAAIHGADLAKFPGGFINVLKLGLASTNETIRVQAFEVIESRNLLGFDDFLGRMGESDEREDLRYRAFAILGRQDVLSEQQVNLLIDDLASDEPRKRVGAAGALRYAQLYNQDMIRLAKEALPKADALTMPWILETFHGATNTVITRIFTETMMADAGLREIANPRTIERIIKTFPASLADKTAGLLEEVTRIQAEQLQRLRERSTLLRGGEVDNGRRVFFSEKAQCSACHEVGGEGGHLGPDLTAIGRVRSGLDILEAILFPNASFVPGYEPMKVASKGELHSGIIARETPATLTLRVDAKTELHLNRKEITEIRAGEVSIMPAGLDQSLSETEMRDLLAYLQSLNGEKWLQGETLGNERKPALSPAERAARQ